MAMLDVSRKFGNNCTAFVICASSLCSDWYIQVIVIVSATG